MQNEKKSRLYVPIHESSDNKTMFMNMGKNPYGNKTAVISLSFFVRL